MVHTYRRIMFFYLMVMLSSVLFFYATPSTQAQNNDPVNEECIIINMDDTDNLYAKASTNYYIYWNVSDADGREDIDYVEVSLKQAAATRATFRYDEDEDNATIMFGSDKWDLGSWGVGYGTNWLDGDFYITPQWDAVEEADLELEIYVCDTVGASDNDTLTDYCDVVSDVLTTFSLNPTSGSVSSSTTASGVLKYASDPNSTTQGTVPVEVAEVTRVSVYNEDNENQGNDTFPLLGEWSIIFDVPDEAGEYTYNLYIDMADAEYTDGEETPSDTFTAKAIITGPVGPTDPNQPPSTSVVYFKVTVAGSAAEDCVIGVYEAVYDMYQGTVQTDAQGKANMSLSYGEYRYDAEYEGMSQNGTFLHYGAYLLIEIQFEKARLPLSPNLTKLLIGVCIIAAAVYAITKIKK